MASGSTTGTRGEANARAHDSHPTAAHRSKGVEALIAEAQAAGKVSGPLLAAWRQLGMHDLQQLQELARVAPSLDDLAAARQALTKLLEQADRLGAFMQALRLAALEESERGAGNRHGRLYWPHLLKGVEEMIPDVDALDKRVDNVLRSAVLLMEGAGGEQRK